jgi:DNA polymerase I
MSTIAPYPNHSYRLIQTERSLRRVLPTLLKAKRFSIDIETTGLDPHLDQIRLIQIALPHHPVYLFDLFTLPMDAITSLKSLLQGDALKIGQYLKFEWQFLTAKGFGFNGPFFDCQLAFKTLIAGLKGKTSLQAIARRILG